MARPSSGVASLFVDLSKIILEVLNSIRDAILVTVYGSEALSPPVTVAEARPSGNPLDANKGALSPNDELSKELETKSPIISKTISKPITAIGLPKERSQTTEPPVISSTQNNSVLETEVDNTLTQGANSPETISNDESSAQDLSTQEKTPPAEQSGEEILSTQNNSSPVDVAKPSTQNFVYSYDAFKEKLLDIVPVESVQMLPDTTFLFSDVIADTGRDGRLLPIDRDCTVTSFPDSEDIAIFGTLPISPEQENELSTFLESQKEAMSTDLEYILHSRLDTCREESVTINNIVCKKDSSGYSLTNKDTGKEIGHISPNGIEIKGNKTFEEAIEKSGEKEQLSITAIASLAQEGNLEEFSHHYSELSDEEKLAVASDLDLRSYFVTGAEKENINEALEKVNAETQDISTSIDTR